jgi:uncharacterized iron-regulated protein
VVRFICPFHRPSEIDMPSAPKSAATRVLAVCACLLGATTDAISQSEWNRSDWGRWAEGGSSQHPLAGRIYDVAKGTLADPVPAAGGPVLLLPEGLVLLGEMHDNPAHHQVQAWLIADALKARPQWRPAVVFEQIDSSRQEAVDRFETLDAGARTADSLFGLLKWQESGWPPADIYRPLFEAVLGARLPVYAGDLPRAQMRSVARSGLMQIAAEERTRLGLDRPLPAPLADAVRQELEESHCGALPPQALGGMAVAQRYRDAYMAGALFDAASRHGSAVLIAGNGHVRTDRGVPWHLRQRAPGTPVTAVLVVEVEDGKTEPADYVTRDPDGHPAADFMIFTPRASREDPCQAMRKKG